MTVFVNLCHRTIDKIVIEKVMSYFNLSSILCQWTYMQSCEKMSLSQSENGYLHWNLTFIVCHVCAEKPSRSKRILLLCVLSCYELFFLALTLCCLRLGGPALSDWLEFVGTRKCSLLMSVKVCTLKSRSKYNVEI